MTLMALERCSQALEGTTKHVPEGLRFNSSRWDIVLTVPAAVGLTIYLKSCFPTQLLTGSSYPASPTPRTCNSACARASFWFLSESFGSSSASRFTGLRGGEQTGKMRAKLTYDWEQQAGTWM